MRLQSVKIFAHFKKRYLDSALVVEYSQKTTDYIAKGETAFPDRFTSC